MKHIIRLSAIFLISITLYNCNSRKSANEDNSVKFNDLEEVQTIKFGDTNYFDTSFLVKLETNTDALIADITQLEVFDNKIYIYDKTIEKIMSFDFQGNFKGTIGKKGRAPEEYSSLSGFYINPYDSTINLFDPLMMMVKKYTPDGKYLNGVNHNNENLCFIAKAVMLNENQLFCYYNSNWIDNYLYAIVDIKDYGHSREIESYPYKSSRYISYTLSSHPYSIRDGKISYNKLFSNTLYTYKNELSKPYLTIENKKEISDKLLNHRLKDTEGDYYKLKNELITEDVYNTGFINLFENDRFLLTDFLSGKSIINAILWDKKQKKGMHITKYSTYTPDLQLFKSVSENSIICIWNSSAILAFRQNIANQTATDYPEDVRKAVENFNEEEDNPILIIHTLKNE